MPSCASASPASLAQLNGASGMPEDSAVVQGHPAVPTDVPAALSQCHQVAAPVQGPASTLLCPRCPGLVAKHPVAAHAVPGCHPWASQAL